jgi:hypothetical protein
MVAGLAPNPLRNNKGWDRSQPSLQCYHELRRKNDILLLIYSNVTDEIQEKKSQRPNLLLPAKANQFLRIWLGNVRDQDNRGEISDS